MTITGMTGPNAARSIGSSSPPGGYSHVHAPSSAERTLRAHAGEELAADAVAVAQRRLGRQDRDLARLPLRRIDERLERPPTASTASGRRRAPCRARRRRPPPG
jgi:hypothetical protein